MVSTMLIYFRPWAYVRGFSRETIVEITTNVESQEYRRRENHIIGYAEHPRAGGTDDLENFFSIIHRILGSIFTVKQFKEVWNQVVRYGHVCSMYTVYSLMQFAA